MDAADAIDRARRLQEEGKEGEALELLLAAARESPHEDLDAELAHFYTERGLRRGGEEGLRDLEEAKGWADLPLTLAAEAAVRLEAGERERPEALLARALEGDPELALAHLTLGKLRLEKGEPGSAAAALATALELAPDHGPAYGWLAAALRKMGRPEEAERVLLEGLRRNPYESMLFDALGDFYAERREYAKARLAWRRAAEINWRNLGAWLGLAWAAAQEGDEVETGRAVAKAMELDPQATRSWLAKESPAAPLLRMYVE